MSADHKDFRVKFYERQIQRIVSGLRDLANDVENAGIPRSTPGITGTPRFARSAEQVIHNLIWGMANLNADGLIEAAVQADMSETES